MRPLFQFHALRPLGPARPLRGWRRPAPAVPPAESPLAGLPPDLLLEAGDVAADPDLLLDRPTLSGLTEQALLHAINFGDLASLQTFRGFGPGIATKILEFRAREKFFTSLDELVRVPLVGPSRFRKLVGRENFFLALPLHSALRLPPARPVRAGDLSGLSWPAPGLPRLALGLARDQETERRAAARGGWHLHERRVGPAALPAVLYVHTLAPQPEGRAALLLATLPRLLRPRFTPSAVPAP